MRKNPGFNVFSPITHSHPVAMFLGNGLSHDFWLKQDFSYLDNWAEYLLIPIDVPAWKKSKGIAMEVERFDGAVLSVRNSGEIEFYPDRKTR